MPPRDSYLDRVFTTGTVAFPGAEHVDESKDFSAVIKRALELGGYSERIELPGANDGKQVTTGFGRDAVLSLADAVVSAVKAGDIRHFFLVGGCLRSA